MWAGKFSPSTYPFYEMALRVDSTRNRCKPIAVWATWCVRRDGACRACGSRSSPRRVPPSQEARQPYVVSLDTLLPETRPARHQIYAGAALDHRPMILLHATGWDLERHADPSLSRAKCAPHGLCATPPRGSPLKWASGVAPCGGPGGHPRSPTSRKGGGKNHREHDASISLMEGGQCFAHGVWPACLASHTLR